VVDDDPDVRDLVVWSLEVIGAEVATAATGAEALEVCRRLDPDLVTLDLSLPDADGMDLCRTLRDFTDAYIIIITGRGEERDRLVGLQSGADDYLAKPFSPHELQARAQALLRRPRLSSARRDQVAGDVVVGRLVVSPAQGDARLGDAALGLTAAELDVLAVLASEPGRAWRREDLTRQIWEDAVVDSDYLVDVHVANVRRKLRESGERHAWIRTVDGVAYRLEPSG
jgi:DNA-binding response OmpR family regulator